MKKIFLALLLVSFAVAPSLVIAQMPTVEQLQAQIQSLQAMIPQLPAGDSRIAQLQAQILALQNMLASIQGSGSSITVTSPNGGENWRIGETHNITWTNRGSNAINSNVQIGIIDTRYSTEAGVRAEQIIANSISNSGNYSWTIPQNVGTMNLTDTNQPVYKIVIHSWSDAVTGVALGDSSDASFTISSSSDSTQQLIAQLQAMIVQLIAQINALLARPGVGTTTPPIATAIPTPGYSSPLDPVITDVAGPASLAVGQQGTWTVRVTAPAGAYLAYNVNWGDGLPVPVPSPAVGLASVSNQSSFSHAYAQPGTYTATFSVANNNQKGGGNFVKTGMTVVVGNQSTSQPYITSLSANSATLGTRVTVYGSNFSTSVINQVSFNNATHDNGVNGVTSSDGKTVTFTVPPIDAGSYLLSVENTAGQHSNSVPFNVSATSPLPVTAPNLSVSNTSAVLGSALTSTANGQVTRYATTYRFTLINNGTSDAFVSNNAASFVTVSGSNAYCLVSNLGPNTSLAGDTASAYVIPAGSSRSFTVGGVISSEGSASAYMKIAAINYGTSASNPAGQRVTTGLDSLQVSAMFSSVSTPAPVPATCGPANGGLFYATPTSNLCGTGSVVSRSVLPASMGWSWYCGKTTTDYSAYCTAKLNTLPPMGIPSPTPVLIGSPVPPTPTPVLIGSPTPAPIVTPITRSISIISPAAGAAVQAGVATPVTWQGTGFSSGETGNLYLYASAGSMVASPYQDYINRGVTQNSWNLNLTGGTFNPTLRKDLTPGSYYFVMKDYFTGAELGRSGVFTTTAGVAQANLNQMANLLQSISAMLNGLR